MPSCRSAWAGGHSWCGAELRERYDPGSLLHGWFAADEGFKDERPPGR